ncbi:unnamed protein product [Macrosiphum euphorbiae]|uniref:Uncharacterized protein n=1 Tax=Macrosiphum euphorbiae TaxID=13131 RepID=A0AAV0XLA8_9HEMI|nr:unnamed protein product [Macrosiphum euphorbiae]
MTYFESLNFRKYYIAVRIEFVRHRRRCFVCSIIFGRCPRKCIVLEVDAMSLEKSTLDVNGVLLENSVPDTVSLVCFNPVVNFMRHRTMKNSLFSSHIVYQNGTNTIAIAFGALYCFYVITCVVHVEYCLFNKHSNKFVRGTVHLYLPDTLNKVLDDKDII